MIEIHHAEKLLKTFDCIWFGKIADSKHFVRQWGYSFAVDVVAEEIKITAAKLTFCCINHQPMLLQTFKHETEMTHVF